MTLFQTVKEFKNLKNFKIFVFPKSKYVNNNFSGENQIYFDRLKTTSQELEVRMADFYNEQTSLWLRLFKYCYFTQRKLIKI